LKHGGTKEAKEILNTDNTDDPIKTDCQKVRKARAYHGLTRMNTDQKENHHRGKGYGEDPVIRASAMRG